MDRFDLLRQESNGIDSTSMYAENTATVHKNSEYNCLRKEKDLYSPTFARNWVFEWISYRLKNFVFIFAFITNTLFASSSNLLNLR